MLINIAYFLIFLASCILGAIVGLGGGVIIRPILDAINHHHVSPAAFLTSIAVVIMAMVSTGKKVSDGTKINFQTAALISIGSAIGGFLGDLIIRYLVNTFEVEDNVRLAQTVATIITLALAIYYTKRDDLRYEIKTKALFPIIGVGLGTLAVFLGIGGGPINVPLFMILFSLPVKVATAYSIVVIFFSHITRLINMALYYDLFYVENLRNFDLLPYLWFIAPAAIIGGIIGAMLSKRFSNDTVKRMFMITMYGLIVINIYNGVVFLFL